MARSWTTIVAVAAMALLALVLLPGSLGSHPQAPTASPRPAASDWVYTTSQYGTPTSLFWVGHAYGEVAFSAYDPLDNSATVAINDLNASRDGLTNPVKSWTVNFNAGPYNDSWVWNFYYLLPFSLQYGGTWNITISGASAGFYNTTFQVQTYTVSGTPTARAYLVDHSGSIAYSVNWTVNNAPDSTLTNIEVTASYLNSVGATPKLPGFPQNLTVAAQGTFSFTVPSDANSYGWIAFTIFANHSSNSENTTVIAPVGHLSDPSITLQSCANGCYTSTYFNGQTVYANVYAYIIAPGADAFAANITATFQFSAGASPVTNVPGNPPKNLTTNASGQAEILFTASAPPFLLSSSNSVTVTLSDPVNPSGGTTTSTADFTVVSAQSAQARLALRLGSLQYYGGDTISATWQIGGVNASSVTNWSGDGWQAWGSTGTLMAWGTFPAGQTSGSFSFGVPVNFGGTVTVTVSAHNASSSLSTSQSATVTQPSILLSPSEQYFLAGDTITVTVTTLGSAFNGASMWQSVVDSSGNSLSQGALNGETITFTIPSVAAPNYVSVSVAAESSTYGVFSRASIYIYEGSGIVFNAGVSTPSSYSDGSYQPGQTVTITWKLTTVGTGVVPNSFQISIYPSCYYCSTVIGAKTFETSSTSGSFSYKLPDDLAAGTQQFSIFAQSSVAGCGFYGCYSGTQFSLLIQPSPSPLSYELGAGSGVTVGWTILLVLLVVVLIVAIWMGRRKGGRPMMMKPEGGSGDSGGKGAWQESSPPSGASSGRAGGESPPLPPPSS